MAPKCVRADYEQLADIARGFAQEAEKTRRTLNELHGALDVLLHGDWAGRGATEFYREMITDVFPSVQRLAEALEQAARAVARISRLMKQAEDECAALFKIDWAERYRQAGQGGGPDLPGPIDDWIRAFFQWIGDTLGHGSEAADASAPATHAPGVIVIENAFGPPTTTPEATTVPAPTEAPTQPPPLAQTPPPTPIADSFQSPLAEGSFTLGIYQYGIAYAGIPGWDGILHPGNDYLAAEGTDVTAMADGKVVWAEDQGAYGTTVVLEHILSAGEHVYSLYAHLGTESVSYGQQIKRGEVIGEVGHSGDGSGGVDHLHLEIRKAGAMAVTETNAVAIARPTISYVDLADHVGDREFLDQYFYDPTGFINTR